jgi:hypothetical protein
MRGRHRWLIAVCLGPILAIGGFLAWCDVDSQAIPETVDMARSIIGDRAVLKLESTFYRIKNRHDERAYSQAVAEGKASVHASIDLKPPLPPARDAGAPAGEGEWVDKGWYHRTSVYPEPRLGSTADIVLIDPCRVDLHLVCGTRDPAPDGAGRIPDGDLAKTAMAFSGGWQYRHDHCGIVVDGRTLRPMKKGAGTLVVYRNGAIAMGKWGRDFAQITPDMRYVRQCLLLIDDGKFVPDQPYDVYTLDKKTYVFRSGIGLTKEGKLVYAAGDNLSAPGLARAMIAAGVVTAMHLDMNLGNATCGLFTKRGDRFVVLPLTGQFRNPKRFLDTNYRDFFYLTMK